MLFSVDRRGDDSLSNSPMSFHTPNNEGDSDYQNDIDEVRRGVVKFVMRKKDLSISARI